VVMMCFALKNYKSVIALTQFGVCRYI